MESPLLPYANCTLAFRIPSGSALNPDTLNEETTYDTVTIRAIVASRKSSTVVQMIKRVGGVDPATGDYLGRALKPQALPLHLEYPIKVNIDFDDGENGVMTLRKDRPSPYFDEVSLLGQPISGTIEFNR